MVLLLAPALAGAQGTLLFDQQSSTDETPVMGVPRAGFQQEQPFGQSFTPTFSSVGFIRLNLADSNPGNALGATLLVNLRAGSITGQILETTTPVSLPDGFRGTVNFFFSSAVPLTPGLQYCVEPIVQSGDLWTSATSGDAIYPGGGLYIRGVPVAGTSLWFREGIVVPEPSIGVLSMLGLGVFALARRLKR